MSSQKKQISRPHLAEVVVTLETNRGQFCSKTYVQIPVPHSTCPLMSHGVFKKHMPVLHSKHHGL